MTYVNGFSEYADLRGIDLMELPEGLRATGHTGRVYEHIGGFWTHVGESDPWVLDDDASNCYRIDYDPLDPLASPFEYGGHIYAEGDEVEFLHGGRWIRTILRFDSEELRSSHPWRGDDDYKPFILTPSGFLCGGIDDLRPYEPEPMADREHALLASGDPENPAFGPETLHTIDCHGVDPAIIQDYLDGYIAYREAVAEAEALAGKARAADDRQRDLHERHCANREALRAVLNAVSAA